MEISTSTVPHSLNLPLNIGAHIPLVFTSLLLSIYNIVVCQYVVCSVYYTDIKCRLYVNCTHIITIFLSCSVIDILLDVHSGKDWPHALLAHVPRRKGFQLKPVADNNDDLDTITNSANSHYIIKDRG